MNLKNVIICWFFLFLNFFCSTQIMAMVKLNDIVVINDVNQSIVKLTFNSIPVTYTIFSLHNPERIVIDFSKNVKISRKIIPLYFKNKRKLIKSVRLNLCANQVNLRLVLDLTNMAYIDKFFQKKNNKNYNIILKIVKKITLNQNQDIKRKNFFTLNSNVVKNFSNNKRTYNSVFDTVFDRKKIINTNRFNLEKKNIGKKKTSLSLPIIVAIDAGHGGQDPGATGCNGVFEKNITINIARKLKILLDSDPIFEAIMIRDGDYFISVIERSDIARKKFANVLVSIHTDASLNSNVRGASVWILSDQRAQNEVTNWLKYNSEKYSELLGGLSSLLTNYRNDPYFSRLVLDLQFCYFQRVGYDIAINVLQQLNSVAFLHKTKPEYSNFGILRSPDIPSILVETGFISNMKEASLLSKNEYQEEIARALYKALYNYFVFQKKDVS